MTCPLITIQNLSKVFPTRNEVVIGVSNISLELHKGEVLGLVGESGCGKTTLARLLIGLETPTQGKIFYNGKDISSKTLRTQQIGYRKIQMIFQDPYSSLDPRMTVEQILCEPLQIHFNLSKQAQRDTCVQALQLVGLSAYHLQRFPHEFSGGQRQRIGIARAIIVDPELIICDEPVSGLDVSIQAQIINLLKDLQQEKGLTYLFISHNLAVVHHLSQRIAVMQKGLILEIQETGKLHHSPHSYTQSLFLLENHF